MSLPTSILVATDFGECSKDALADAFRLAAKLDAKVHLVHVFSLQGVTNAAALPTSALDDAAQSAERRLSATAQEYRTTGRLGQVVVHRGDPAPMILLTAEQLRPDLIMLGTHNRHGLSRLMLGSVAEAVVRRAACSVMVVRAPASGH